MCKRFWEYPPVHHVKCEQRTLWMQYIETKTEHNPFPKPFVGRVNVQVHRIVVHVCVCVQLSDKCNLRLVLGIYAPLPFGWMRPETIPRVHQRKKAEKEINIHSFSLFHSVRCVCGRFLHRVRQFTEQLEHDSSAGCGAHKHECHQCGCSTFMYFSFYIFWTFAH